MEKNPQDSSPLPNKNDNCIICKQDTGYKINTSIHNRHFYIEGAGQMCGSCYYATNNVSTTFNIDLDDIYEYHIH